MILKRCREGKPGEICRSAFPRFITRATKVSELRRNFQEAKVNLANEQDSSMVDARKRFVYQHAIRLLACGGLDGFEDILDHANSPKVRTPRGGWEHLWFFPCLLPFPSEFDVCELQGQSAFYIEDWIIENREKVRQWYRENKDRLVWDAEQDRYVLKDETSTE